jgi:cytochrome c oxidase assembly factor CtaG
VALWITGVEVVADAVLGLAIMADQNLIAGSYYRALGRPWGPGLRADQVIGGGALWLLGDLIGLPFLAAMLIQMVREDTKEAQVVDAALDAADATSGAAGAGPATAGAGSGPAGTAQPWWESDPRFTGRFRRPGGT